MKVNLMDKALVAAAGLALAWAGLGILFMTRTFYASLGLSFEGDVNLLNEVRAPAGIFVAVAAFIFIGVFAERLFYAASALGCAIYLSLFLSRSISMLTDGLPNGAVQQAAAIELLLGLACAFTLWRSRNPKAIGGRQK